MAKVNWTFQALEDMAEIAEYHDSISETYSSFLVDEFFSVEKQLSSFPYSGRIVPESNISSIREIIAHKYRLIYSVPSPDKVDILAVRHSSKPLGEI